MKKIYFSFVAFVCCFSQLVAQIAAGNVYKISTLYTGNRVLTVKNSAPNNSEQVFAWTETGVNAQRWRTVDAGSGKFFLENVFTGKRLQATSATSIVQSTGTSAAFQWDFEQTTDIDTPNAYYITNANRSNTVLELATGTTLGSDGSELRFYTKGTAEPRQIWKLEQVTEEPNVVSPAIRTRLMTAWKNHYFTEYKNAGGFWGEAEAMEIILDAYERTGLEEYKTMFEEKYAQFVGPGQHWGSGGQGTDWRWNDFNDDITWAVLASIRAHLMFGSGTGNKNYLQLAKQNYDWMYSRALYKVDNLYNLLRWKEGQNGTNSCIDGPATVAACYLAIATNDNTYYTKAKELYANQRIHMYDVVTGRVWDNFGSNWASPYNQGTYLGAALMLYNRFGDEMYKKDAETIMNFTRTNMCNSEGILNGVNGEDSESGDYVHFKAILLRYVRRLVEDQGKIEYGEWLQQNALRTYNNCNSSGISTIFWKNKTAEGSVGGNLFSVLSAVAIAMNAPTDLNTIYKPAFQSIKAGSFNYISKCFSENVTTGENLELAKIENGAYLGYNLLQFNNNFPSQIELEVSNGSGERLVEIRIDSPTGTLIGTVAIPAGSETWQTVSGIITQQITGTKNIYLVFTGTKNTLRFRSLKFISDGIVYSSLAATDITDDGGELTSQFAGDNTSESLEKLTDNNAETKYYVRNQSNLWMQYNAVKRYNIKKYNITSANDEASREPKNWTLFASENGTTWLSIDTRENQVFDTRNATQSFPVSDTITAYQYFKLQITANNGGDDTQIAEWQLIGEPYYDNFFHDFVETGTLSSSVNAQNLAALADNNPKTVCTLPATTLPITINVKLPVAIQMMGYTITSGDNAAADPKSWVLRGSQDGINYTQIETRNNQTFASRHLKRNFDKTITSAYQYFQLEISALSGNAADLKIAEFEINGYYMGTYDVTYNPNSTLTAQWDGNYTEGGTDERYTKLIDKNKTGKYLQNGRKSFWVKYKSARPVHLIAYSLISANDAPNRDPQTWTLYGCDKNLSNLSSWTVIDRQENQVFPYRLATQYFVCDTTDKFTYFQLIVDSNQGEKNVQLAEWQLFGIFNDFQSDITENGGVITSSHPANNKTDVRNLIDNSETTLYSGDLTVSNFATGVWFKYESTSPAILTSYSLTSSNDNPNYDPQSWILQASNDSVNWTDLDTQTAIEFAARSERKEFNVANATAYKFFRLFVTAKKGTSTTARGFLLAEWELFGTQTSVKNVQISNLTIFPNPAEKFVTIAAQDAGMLEIYNMKGDFIMAQTIAEGDISIDVQHFPQGTYIVKLLSTKKVQTGTFIKK